MKKLFVAALSCSLVVMQPAWAGVGLPTPPAPAVASGHGEAKVTEVRWRGHRWHRHHHHHRHRGPGLGAFGAGLAVGVIGALIANGISESSARERFARCEADFRSFDPETGTYITRSGEERLCPYLR